MRGNRRSSADIGKREHGNVFPLFCVVRRGSDRRAGAMITVPCGFPASCRCVRRATRRGKGRKTDVSDATYRTSLLPVDRTGGESAQPVGKSNRLSCVHAAGRCGADDPEADAGGRGRRVLREGCNGNDRAVLRRPLFCRGNTNDAKPSPVVRRSYLI